MALIDPADLEREIDELYLAEVRFELDLMMRARLVEWGRNNQGEKFFFAVESASRGYWDDVRNDLRRDRITIDQANQIADKCVEYKLITGRQAEFYKAQFEIIEANK
jgi:hypothetical protein